ncbi:S-layer homology domain-containing protein [Candidatus Saccharibacteria bacterium]|nr:S-layer homology domain-containing protein [Candidatus Saccharibacteria bacterium]
MKKIISSSIIVLTFALVISVPAFASWEGGYHWEGGYFYDTADPVINRLHELGIVNGDGEGNFHPLGTITKGEWAQMLYRAFSNTEAIPQEDNLPWYAPAMSWLGMSDENGNESASITWAYQAAFRVWRNSDNVEYTDPVEWAKAHNADVHDYWRTWSKGEYFSRQEACNLFFQLGEIS